MTNDYIYNPTKEQIEDFVRQVYDVGMVAFDIETTGLDPHTDKILLVQFAVPDFAIVLSNGLHKDLIGILESPKIIKLGVNLKFDTKFIRKLGYRVNNTYDLMVVEACLRLGLSYRVGLASLAERYLGVFMDKTTRKGFIGRTSRKFTKAELDYAAKDTLLLFPIYEKQLEVIEAMHRYGVDLQKTIDLENRLVPVMAEMEFNGIGYAPDRVAALQEELTEELIASLGDLINLLPERDRPEVQTTLFGDKGVEARSKAVALNINSSQAVLDYLDALGFHSDTTDKFVLQQALKSNKTTPEAKKFIEVLLEYRKNFKAIRTYLGPLASLANPATGRIHFDYTQIAMWATGGGANDIHSGTVTGRLSCKRFHQIPKSKTIRHAFVARPGYKTITADFSNVELRIAAIVTGEQVLIDFFNNPELSDYHGYMASRVFGVPLESVANMVVNGVEVPSKNPGLRAKAKTTNFGLIYGIGPVKLAKQLEITEEEAMDIIDNYEQTLTSLMPGLRAFGDFAIQNGFIPDQSMGRVRFFSHFTKPEVAEKYEGREIGSIKRQAANMPIQGTSANQMKLALVKVQDAIDSGVLEGSYLIGTVHDEVIVEVPEEHANEYAKVVEKLMIESANEVLSGPVPYSVGLSIENSWTK